MENECEIKQYKKRWINLLVFVLYAINNGIHWVQFTIINNVISDYYHVSPTTVEWTSGIYMLTSVVLSIPALYLLDKMKVKHLMIFVNILTCLGSWLKLFSVVPDRFYVAFIAQTMEAIPAVFTYGLAARFTADWFGIHEISRAGALAIFGDQFGNAISFVIPVLFVPNTSDVELRENGLMKLHKLNAALSTIVLILVIVVFKDQPKNPPSVAQALKKVLEKESLLVSFFKMMKNRAFIMMLFAYTLAGSTVNGLCTVINEIVLMNFPDNYRDAGRIGSLIMVVGMVMSPVTGYVLDKTRKFKEISIILYAGSLISLVLFSASLKSGNIIYVYLASVIIGTFFVSIYGNGCQIGIEIIYPLSEDKCTLTMSCLNQLLSLITTFSYSALFKRYDDVVANVFLCSMCAIAVLLPIFAPINLKRQKADTKIEDKELTEILHKKPEIF